MTHHYLDLGSASDWSSCVGNVLQPIKSTTQFWVVTRHRYGISALVSQKSFLGETVGGVANVISFLRLRTLILNPQELRQYRQMGYFIEKKQTAPLLPPVHSKLGCWLSPTVLSSNTSTKLHGGGRGGKATFFSFEVFEMSEARER